MIERVAFLSMHTSPLLQPGVGDAGGMNVYLDELARSLAQRGIEVDVFTRRTAAEDQPVVRVADGYRVFHIAAGRSAPLSTLEQTGLVGEFAAGVLDVVSERAVRYDVVHSHYWLSGWAGLIVKRALGLPMADSFHTLGRVKDVTRREGQPPESLLRIAAEHEVISSSDCVIASTPREAADLMDHYGADPSRLCVSPPGVNHEIFRPGDRAEARRRLGIDPGAPVVLFVGRIQPLKGPDVALSAFARVREEIPEALLYMVGGPSGPHGPIEYRNILSTIRSEGLADAVCLTPPQPHHGLASFYQMADVLLFPSRSESFGLVAVEAQACGLPVVASDVGGLGEAVSDGHSGVLLSGWEPSDYAAAVLGILGDPARRRRLADGAVEFAERFSWDATTLRLVELYEGITGSASSG